MVLAANVCVICVVSLKNIFHIIICLDIYIKCHVCVSCEVSMSTDCPVGLDSRRTSTESFSISQTLASRLGRSAAFARPTASSLWVWVSRSPPLGRSVKKPDDQITLMSSGLDFFT